jgi:hypothetical protein
MKTEGTAPDKISEPDSDYKPRSLPASNAGNLRGTCRMSACRSKTE